MSSILLLYILLPIAAILLGCLIFILMVNNNTKKLHELLVIAKDKTDEKNAKSIGTIYSRVTSISESNISITKVQQELELIYTDYINNLMSLQKQVSEFEMSIDKAKLSIKKSLKIYKDIESKYPDLDRIEKKFMVLSDKVISQDSLIRKEFTFFQSNLREAKDVYKNKRILLDRISGAINKLDIQIKELEKEFENIIEQADIHKSSIVLNKYVQKVNQYVKIISEGPSISMHLKVQIPKVVEKLTKLYRDRKNDGSTNLPLTNIQFQKSIKEISKKFKKADAAFNTLQIEKSKKLIRGVLKGFKVVESQINLEVKSRNSFTKNYNQFILQVKKILRSWVSVKKQFKDLSASGKFINPQIIDKYINLKKYIKSLDVEAMEIREITKKKNVPYSTKLQRIRFATLTLKQSIDSLNEFVEKIWEVNYKSSVLNGKFKRSENAIHNLLAQIKDDQILLTNKEEKRLNDLIDVKSKLSKIFKSETITEKNKKDVDAFSENTTSLFLLLNGKIQIAMHTKNLIREFGPKRALDAKLNVGFKLVEKQYIEGKYTESLNLAIETIKGAK